MSYLWCKLAHSVYVIVFSPAAPSLPASDYKLTNSLRSTSLPMLVTPDAFMTKSVSGASSMSSISPSESHSSASLPAHPLMEKDASVLVISLSESASKDEQDLLTMAAPTRVSSLDEGPTQMLYSIL